MTSTQPGLNWIGLHIDNRVIAELARESSLYWVYVGQDLTAESSDLIKVAKQSIDDRFTADQFSELALVEREHRWQALDLAPARVLVRQAAKALSREDPRLLRLRAVVLDAGLPYVRMEKPQGTNWTVLDRPDRKTVISLLQVLKDLESTFGRNWHGNLRPDSLWVSESGIRIEDSTGWFDTLNAEAVAVTTPAYYPYLRNDDCLAVGIILYEALMRLHPFTDSALDPRYYSCYSFSDDLLRAADDFTGIYGKWFAQFQPGRRNEVRISREFESVLLRAIGLELDAQGRLSLSSPYASFDEMLEVFTEHM